MGDRCGSGHFINKVDPACFIIEKPERGIEDDIQEFRQGFCPVCSSDNRILDGQDV